MLALALPDSLAGRLDAKYGRDDSRDVADDARSACDAAEAEDDDLGPWGELARERDEAEESEDGGAVLHAPLCADGRTALLALRAAEEGAAEPTHVSHVRDAPLAARLEELPAPVRAFWSARFDTADDGSRAPRDVACDGVLLGRVADARVGECLVAATRLDPSLARADHVAASWLRVAVRKEGRGFVAWQRLHGGGD